MDWSILHVLSTPYGAVLSSVLIGSVLLLALVSRLTLKRSQRLDPAEVQERLDAGMTLLVLDVRSPDEFAACHVEGALNLSVAALGRALDDPGCALPADRDCEIAVIARTVSLAERSANCLRRCGYQRVRVIDGGMRGWCADRLPLARPEEAAPVLSRR